jgi:hypothetical protein
MRMPEAEACPCGGGCPRCDHAPHSLLRETAHSSGAAPIGAEQPRLVQAVLASAGDALDVSATQFHGAALRSRFQRRAGPCGHRGSRVCRLDRRSRLYSGVAHRVRPRLLRAAHNAGRQLLAHELAHVVQGDRSGTIHRSLTRRQEENENGTRTSSRWRRIPPRRTRYGSTSRVCRKPRCWAE